MLIPISCLRVCNQLLELLLPQFQWFHPCCRIAGEARWNVQRSLVVRTTGDRFRLTVLVPDAIVGAAGYGTSAQPPRRYETTMTRDLTDTILMRVTDEQVLALEQAAIRIPSTTFEEQ